MRQPRVRSSNVPQFGPSFKHSNGKWLRRDGWVKLYEQPAIVGSGGIVLELPWFSADVYRRHRIYIIEPVMTSVAAQLYMRVSTDNAATWVSNAAGYNYGGIYAAQVTGGPPLNWGQGATYGTVDSYFALTPSTVPGPAVGYPGFIEITIKSDSRSMAWWEGSGYLGGLGGHTTFWASGYANVGGRWTHVLIGGNSQLFNHKGLVVEGLAT